MLGADGPVVGLAAAALPLAYLPDRFLDAASPGVAMPRKHLISGDCIQARQRFDRLGGVRGEGRELRAARPRGHRVGSECVANEQRAERYDLQDRTTGGVAGCQDHPRATGDVQGCPVAEGRDLVQLGGTKPAVQQGEPQKPEERPELHRAVAL